jgi:outer membrane lipoprotein SlyB
MQSGLGFLADNVLPFAASFIPGIGPIAGAALGSAVSSGLQGRSLQDALMRAAIAGGTAYAGGQLFGPASPTTTAPMTGVNADLIPNALQGLNFGSLTSAAIPAGVGGAAGNIIVNAAGRAASNLAGSTVGGVLGQAAASQIAAPNQSNVVDGVDRDTGEIVVSKYRPINPPGGFDPIALLQGPGLGSALAGVPELTELAMDPTLTGPEEDIVVTGNKTVPKTVVPDVLAGLGPLLPTLGIPQVPTPDPALTDKGGVLGTGLNLPQLISIGGIGADLLGSLLGGSGGAGAGAPYVSPFGTGVGFARGQDMRANPNITDYERYGFGPEAMFFRPEYSGLVSAGAPAPQAQPAMAINPVYQPLI